MTFSSFHHSELHECTLKLGFLINSYILRLQLLPWFLTPFSTLYYVKWPFHLILLHVPWSWFATFLCVILRPHTYCLVSRHISFYILWPNGINGWKSSLKLLILRIEITAYNNHLDGAYSRSLHLKALIFKYRSYLSVKRCHDISLLNLLNWRVWAVDCSAYHV